QNRESTVGSTAGSSIGGALVSSLLDCNSRASVVAEPCLLAAQPRIPVACARLVPATSQTDNRQSVCRPNAFHRLRLSLALAFSFSFARSPLEINNPRWCWPCRPVEAPTGCHFLDQHRPVHDQPNDDEDDDDDAFLCRRYLPLPSVERGNEASSPSTPASGAAASRLLSLTYRRSWHGCELLNSSSPDIQKLTMGSLVRSARCVGSLLLLVSMWSTLVAALDITVCASINTADMARNISIYQTNGLCHDFCLQKNNAYAITQGNFCWCSDYTPAPAKQVDKGDCNQPCPAYPLEQCGGNGVFGYIALNNVLPSGTKGGSGPSSTSSKSTDSTTNAPSPTSSMVQTLTTGGTVRTVTIMPTQTGDAFNEGAASRVQSSGLGTGAVVGIVIGIIAAVLALASAALFFYFRHKKQNQDDYQDDPSVRGSSSGMMGGRPEMSAAPGSPGSAGNRNSTLQIDPRMDPFKQGLYARNGSHESVNTLRDDHDYSRRIQQPKVLRAVNPDPAND
ncbi:Uncharacterized protein TPAR_06007, partial [Tolypocladium paradoxum]